MRNNKLIPGVVLLLLGTVFLLRNYGYVDIHWSNFLHLWPIFIVIAGVNMIFANNKAPWAMGIKLAVIIGGFGLLFFGNFENRFGFWPKGNYEFDIDDDSDDNDVVKSESNRFFEEPYNDSIKTARLNIHGGATSYRLRDTTNQLFSAETREFFGKYTFNVTKDDSSSVIDFRMRDNKFKNFGFGDNSNKATFKLNAKPEWELDINAGATDLDFDLTKFKVKILHIDGGAASFKVKFGQPLNVTTIKVNTGASDVDIRIPRGAAACIDVHSGLSSDDFEGFVKIRDHRYETPGYASATNKFNIKINGGVSDFNVKRY
ncbi:hypothetical protein GCM10027049_04900 [Mucilaginibacter puniceus]